MSVVNARDSAGPILRTCYGPGTVVSCVSVRFRPSSVHRRFSGEKRRRERFGQDRSFARKTAPPIRRRLHFGGEFLGRAIRTRQARPGFHNRHPSGFPPLTAHLAFLCSLWMVVVTHCGISPMLRVERRIMPIHADRCHPCSSFLRCLGRQGCCSAERRVVALGSSS